MTKETFLSTVAESNPRFVAQQLLLQKINLSQLSKTFEVLDSVLFKSWAKDMPFTELKQALEIAQHFSKKKP